MSRALPTDQVTADSYFLFSFFICHGLIGLIRTHEHTYFIRIRMKAKNYLGRFAPSALPHYDMNIYIQDGSSSVQ